MTKKVNIERIDNKKIILDTTHYQGIIETTNGRLTRVWFSSGDMNDHRAEGTAIIIALGKELEKITK